MEPPTRRRHRRPPVRRSLPLAAAVAGAVVLVALAVATTVALTDGEPTPSAGAQPTATATVTQPATPATTPAVLTGTRDIRVSGAVVTIVEELSVLEGDSVTAAPARTSTDAALELAGVRLLAEDGTASRFDEPVTLGAGRTLTVQGTYRLRACPDLLPVTWPSPTTFVGDDWSRTWTRTSEPLRTAPTLCEGKRSEAVTLPALQARIAGEGAGGSPPTVRVALRWNGSARLAVDRVGALADLAADSVAPRPAGACPRTGCIGPLQPGGTLAMDIQPVEACPDAAPRPDRLTLVVRQGDGTPRIVAVTVPGLGRLLDRTVCR